MWCSTVWVHKMLCECGESQCISGRIITLCGIGVMFVCGIALWGYGVTHRGSVLAQSELFVVHHYKV